MSKASGMANLVLKVSKCKVVPLCGPFSPELATRVLQEISYWAPEWPSFEVVDCLLYQGIWLGPGAAPDRSWTDPLTKLRLRAQAIGRGTTPASQSA
eukprot:3761586-Pyramimonas_sp.AAC.1